MEKTRRWQDGEPTGCGRARRCVPVFLAALLFATTPLAAQDAGDGTAATAPAAPAAAAQPGKAGKKQSAQVAEGLENWKSGIDLSSYAPGKYNLVVQGKDKAGNLAEYPPFNLYVDPESDLPRVTIVNPTPSLRVGGDLNIVGTCVDDDGVAKVEVSLDGGEYRAAEGTDFWSLYLETASIQDGRRKLDVRGVDVNGVVGRPVHVEFDLDRAKPLAEVSSPPAGSLASGVLKVEGSVFDLNGVASLAASLDGGASFKKVDLRRGKDATRPSFSYSLDTRKLADGPFVLWLRSVDGVGSEAKAAFLVFVDNTKPAIEVARPAAGQAVNGRFTLAGAVRDAVGVKRLTYTFAGGESGEIALTKGDPYFAKELDAGKAKGDKAEILLVAEDTIGNVTRLSLAPRIDRRADLPVLSLAAPSPNGSLRAGEPVWGSIRDDDGVSALRWSVDGGAPTEIPCSETFGFVLPDSLASGKHALSLVPVDVNGLAGDKVVLPFSYDKGAGPVRFTGIAGAKGSRPFAPGTELAVDGGEYLEGEVSAPNPLASMEYALGDSSPKPLPLKAEGGSYKFRLPVDRSFPYGFVSVAIRAKDSAGNSIEGRTLAYVTDYGVIREEPGFRFVDPRVPAEGGDGARVAFGASGDILGAFYREELDSISLIPATDLVEASFDGMGVRLSARKEGLTAPTRIVGRTKRGHKFSAGPYVFAADATPPRLAISSPAEGAWLRGAFELAGTAQDPGGLAEVAYCVLPADGAPGQATALAPRADGSFSAKLSAADLPAGPFSIEVVAKDKAGNESRAWRCLGADADPPKVSFPGLEGGAEVRGSEDVVGIVSDKSGLASVEYAPDGASFSPIAWKPGFFIHRADLAANPKAAYRLTDLAGNVAVARPEVKAAPALPRIPRSPELSVEQAEGEGRVELSGSSGARKATLSLPTLGDTEFAALGLAEGKDPPERMSSRLLVSGALALKGQVGAPSGAEAPLKSVSISYDGGATYLALASYKDQKSAKPSLPFSLSVAAAALKQGEARWALKVEDFSGALRFCPIYALVDLKPPSLSFIYPDAAAASMPGPFPAVFSAEDDYGLASAELAIGASREPIDLSGGGRLFAREIDPAAGPKGAPVAIQLSARDEAGNAAQVARKLAYDEAKDLPSIKLGDLPAACRPGDPVTGSASDDDGPAAVVLSVDGQELGSFPSGAFAVALPELGAGKHRLLAAATDSGGRKAELSREIKVVGPAPSFGELAIGDAKQRSPWTPGAALALGGASSMAGSVSAPNGLASVELSVGGGAPVKASLGKPAAPGQATSFSAPLPAGLRYESAVIALKAVDLAGLSAEARYEIHNVLPSPLPADDAEGLRFVDSRIGGAGQAPSFLLAPGESLEGRFNGRPIAELSLRPTTGALEASFDGSLVKLAAKAEGILGKTELVARTVDGDSFSWGPFEARVDAAPPALEVAAPADHDWLRGKVEISGKASDTQGIVALEVSVNGGSPVPLLGDTALAMAPREAPFDAQVDLAAAADGSVRLDIMARDGAGRESRVTRFINKDSLPPEIAQVLPAPGESVNGTMTVIVEAKDGGRLATAAFKAPAAAKGAADPSGAQATPEVEGLAVASKTLDFARLTWPLAEGEGFAFTDKAGNTAVIAPSLVVDAEKDKPVAEIHTPVEMEVLRGDFSISGVAYDDDGLRAAYYRLDGGEWKMLPMEGTSFGVPMRLADCADNEHLVEVKAEDIYGVQGDVVARRFRISKEEPVARMTEPPLSKPSRGLVYLAGTCSDANGVESVSVSIDSRVSYDKPAGVESWRYPLDTRVVADGLHPVAVEPVDKYGTEGFYASFIYVDNTSPKVAIDLPADGEIASRELLVSGRVSDNLGLASSRIEIAPVGRASPPSLSIDLGVEGIVRRTVDLAKLEPGAYTVRIVARDRADNEALASRDIVVAGGAPADKVEILYPLEGSELSGKLVLYGRAAMAAAPAEVAITAGGTPLGSAKPDALGYFAFEADTGALGDGALALGASAVAADGREVRSRAVGIQWRRLGPWVSIDSFPAGRYLPYRPYLEGSAGVAAEAPDPADKAAVAAFRKAAAAREPVAVEVSLDNGRSFKPASGTSKWRLRLETQDYPEGGLYVIVRARWKDGSSAYAKTLLLLDKTRPEVDVAAPVANGRYNGTLAVSGTAFDADGLDAVTVALRKGDKKSYAVPSFIQGLYVDGHALGATTWEAGLGLTFFDDNVKLQGSFGSAPELDDAGNQQRFFGDVYAVKLIANIGLLPFNALFGPDWDFLSAALGIGADFSYFSHSQSGQGLIVSAVFGQLEFPKLVMKDWKAFKSFSFYTEFQVWVVSSDVEGGFIPRMSFGTRVGVF